jgi:hypothetical protein
MAKTVEYAVNDESVMWSTDHAFSNDKKELAYAYVTTANQALIDDPRCRDLELVYPRGLRGLHSHWAGAGYTYKVGIYGTFADLTSDEQQALSDADSAGLKAMNELAARYEEVSDE